MAFVIEGFDRSDRAIERGKKGYFRVFWRMLLCRAFFEYGAHEGAIFCKKGYFYEAF